MDWDECVLTGIAPRRSRVLCAVHAAIGLHADWSLLSAGAAAGVDCAAVGAQRRWTLAGQVGEFRCFVRRAGPAGERSVRVVEQTRAEIAGRTWHAVDELVSGVVWGDWAFN